MPSLVCLVFWSDVNVAALQYTAADLAEVFRAGHFKWIENTKQKVHIWVSYNIWYEADLHYTLSKFPFLPHFDELTLRN